MSAGTMNEEGQFTDIFIQNEEVRQNLNFVLEENGTTESHVHAPTQLNENNIFHRTVEAENNEDLAYDDIGQEQKESEDNVKHSKAMIEKVEKKTIEDFLRLIEDLDQLEEDLVIESSNKTIGSCEVNADHLNVFAGCIENNLSLEVISNKGEVCSAKHNEEEDVKYEDTVLEEADREIYLLENLLGKSESNCEVELQVNKLYFNSLEEEMKYLEERLRKDESVKDSVSLDREMELLSSNDEDKEDLVYLEGQSKNDGQTFETITRKTI